MNKNKYRIKYTTLKYIYKLISNYKPLTCIYNTSHVQTRFYLFLFVIKSFNK